MRKEMNELRNAIKEKTNQSLDRMIRATNSHYGGSGMPSAVEI